MAKKKTRKKTRKKPGPKPLDPSGTQKPRSVKLTPREVESLQRDYGSVNKGIRALVEAKYPREE